MVPHIPSSTTSSLASASSISTFHIPSNPSSQPSSWQLPSHDLKSNPAAESTTVHCLAQVLTQLGDLQCQFFALQADNAILKIENNQLKNETCELQENAQWVIQNPASISPSDSISQHLLPPTSNSAASNSIILVEQPVAHPEAYPESVIWTLGDCQHDPDIKLSKGNKCHPAMYYCVHKENSNLLLPEQWHALHVATRSIVREILSPLQKHHPLPV
ncbi:hypothetical protein Clacol_004950 [Clathrus columnatus]|uniref:Uncharacterized protein n=1 Tax=Clathrus columnatus TaxID=1419009 RepID=A0AAV5ADJ4_9AGAM|nr:hypothetical protein Clacol_004950 [Clathrus columnatus]